MPAAVALILAAAAALALGRAVADFALATRTDTGLDNRFPPEMTGRVLRLAALARQLESAGVRVTSAWRTHDVNRAVGGVPNSLHTQALALDYVPDSPAAETVLRAWRARGDVTRWFTHDAGTGTHVHVELAP